MARAGRLPLDVQPDTDLWPSIEAAIAERGERGERADTPRLRSWQPMLAQAAAVLLLVGASSGLTYLAVKGDRGSVTPVAATNAPALDVVSASFGDRYSLGPDFQDARRDLEGRLERELGRLPPETRADVEANLTAIRAAIADINAALVEEPDNPLLQELLLRSYRDELTVMRRVNGITNAVMYREDI